VSVRNTRISPAPHTAGTLPVTDNWLVRREIVRANSYTHLADGRVATTSRSSIKPAQPPTPASPTASTTQQTSKRPHASPEARTHSHEAVAGVEVDGSPVGPTSAFSEGSKSDRLLTRLRPSVAAACLSPSAAAACLSPSTPPSTAALDKMQDDARIASQIRDMNPIEETSETRGMSQSDSKGDMSAREGRGGREDMRSCRFDSCLPQTTTLPLRETSSSPVRETTASPLSPHNSSTGATLATPEGQEARVCALSAFARRGHRGLHAQDTNASGEEGGVSNSSKGIGGLLQLLRPLAAAVNPLVLLTLLRPRSGRLVPADEEHRAQHTRTSTPSHPAHAFSRTEVPFQSPSLAYVQEKYAKSVQHSKRLARPASALTRMTVTTATGRAAAAAAVFVDDPIRPCTARQCPGFGLSLLAVLVQKYTY
jgi:hypothetical protein